MFNPYFFPMFIPMLPNDCTKPPTLYSIMNSICNYDSEDYTKIKELAKNSRSKIFNFDYPLTPNMTKEYFEIMILNHFMMRRIGFETVTAFRIQLSVKLNEIMPIYNKLFDALENWNILEDGEIVERTLNENGTNTNNENSEGTNKTTNNSQNNSSNITNMQSSSTTGSTGETINRHSDLPQSQISNINNDSYMTDYTKNNQTNSGSDSSESNGRSDTSADTNSTTNIKDNRTSQSNGSHNNNIVEQIKRSPADKIRIYNEFIENRQNIFSLIFKDLDELFYQIV